MIQAEYLHGTCVLVGVSGESDSLDRAAAVCHEQWRYWAAFMLRHPEEAERFYQLADTEFADLSEVDKNADRHWARLVLAAARGDLDCRSGNRPPVPEGSYV